LSTKSHQSASENRAKFNERQQKDTKRLQLFPWCPRPEAAHPSFSPLRTELLSDATLIHVLWCLIQDHLGVSQDASEQERQSETAMGRAIQILTLGAYAFEAEDKDKCRAWIERTFLYLPANPGEAVTMLEMLHVLGKQQSLNPLSSTPQTSFQAQDSSLLAAAAWLSDFCCKASEKCTHILGVEVGAAAAAAAAGNAEEGGGANEESDMERRKRMAKERALKMMSSNANKFMAGLGDESDEDEYEDAVKDEMELDDKKKEIELLQVSLTHTFTHAMCRH